MNNTSQLLFQDLLAVNKEQCKSIFQEPLTDIYSELEKRQIPLTNMELRYVCNMMAVYLPKPINMFTVAKQIEDHQRSSDRSLQDMIVAADCTLLMLGFFGKIDTNIFWRGRSAFPVEYYRETGKQIYKEIWSFSKMRVYSRLSIHFET